MGTSASSHVIGSSAAMHTLSAEAKAKAVARQEEVSLYLHDLGLPEKLKLRIRRFLTYRYSKMVALGSAEENILAMLSPCLRQELLQ